MEGAGTTGPLLVTALLIIAATLPRLVSYQQNAVLLGNVGVLCSLGKLGDIFAFWRKIALFKSTTLFLYLEVLL